MMFPQIKILIIDDNHDMRVYLRQELESAGYQVVSATSGESALKKIEQGFIPHLVVLDLKMPIMSGEEFLKVRREREDLQRLPVFVLSGNIPEEPIEDVEKVFSKPVEWDALLDSISLQCRRATKIPSADEIMRSSQYLNHP